LSELAPGEHGRPAWSAFRSALEARGFRPSRRLGQNFLLDENMLRAIVRDAGVSSGDTVLEVGPGCGTLSLHLLRAGVDLIAVEIDPRLAEIARELLAGETHLRLIVADVLAGKHAIEPAVLAVLPAKSPWHLVANLPYSVSGPLLASLAELSNPPASMTVLVQREVAQRIAAQPGTSAWGPLSIRLQLAYEPSLVRNVAPALFWPRPEVESTVVRLALRADRMDPFERAALSKLVDALFQRRRQSLLRVLSTIAGSRAAGEEWIGAAGMDPSVRAEDLELDRLRALARHAPGGKTA
jgi:16S rRNA (adenine1518-N6/adenine1519-N6)-dimethyltransferase